MYDQILLATDGSECSERAAAAAIAVASRFDAHLHAIYVLDAREIPAGIEADVTELDQGIGRSALDDVEAQAATAGVSVNTALVESHEAIHESILEEAEERNIDLLVIGSHGRTGIGRILLGSVAERTIRHATMPVLTIRAEPLAGEVDRILVPTDGSAGAIAAADHAVDLARATDAAIHIIHVVDLTRMGGDITAGPVYAEFEDIGREAVDDLIDRAKSAGVRSVQGNVLAGRPGRAIVDYAEDRDIDLIVLGTHGRSGLDRILLGSVAEKVVRIAEEPVMTVRG